MQITVTKVVLITGRVDADLLLLTTTLTDNQGDAVVMDITLGKGLGQEFMRRNYPSIGYTILE